jgi:hypothetical protein
MTLLKDYSSCTNWGVSIVDDLRSRRINFVHRNSSCSHPSRIIPTRALTGMSMKGAVVLADRPPNCVLTATRVRLKIVVTNVSKFQRSQSIAKYIRTIANTDLRPCGYTLAARPSSTTSATATSTATAAGAATGGGGGLSGGQIAGIVAGSVIGGLLVSIKQMCQVELHLLMLNRLCLSATSWITILLWYHRSRSKKASRDRVGEGTTFARRKGRLLRRSRHWLSKWRRARCAYKPIQ